MCNVIDASQQNNKKQKKQRKEFRIKILPTLQMNALVIVIAASATRSVVPPADSESLFATSLLPTVGAACSGSEIENTFMNYISLLDLKRRLRRRHLCSSHALH